MKSLIKRLWLLGLILLLVLAANSLGHAAETGNTPKANAAAAPSAASDTSSSGSLAEKVNVDLIKEKYWAQGNESDFGVVQNRLYSKERKLEVGVFGGIIASDPFLSVASIGQSIGYHFSEYFSAHVLGWKDYVGNSSARQTFIEKTGATTNTNEPRWFLGAEGVASLIYGKLSLAGRSIIYYDMHFSGGAGVTGTESGNNFTPFLGLGQQVYLNKFLAIKLDYRLMNYREMIREKIIASKIGEDIGVRTNWTNSISLGISILYGSPK